MESMNKNPQGPRALHQHWRTLPDQPTAQGLVSHHLAGGEGQLIDQAAGGQGYQGPAVIPGPEMPFSPFPQVSLPTSDSQ